MSTNRHEKTRSHILKGQAENVECLRKGKNNFFRYLDLSIMLSV